MKVEKEALGGQRVEPTEEELALVNRQSRKELTAAEVYLFAVRLCDNEVDRDGEQFPQATLEQLAELFVGKSGIFDHRWSAGGQTARIYRTEVVREEGIRTALGEPACYLKGYAYMVRTQGNQDLIAEIASNPEHGEWVLDILMIAKYLERIGDHATNIAEWVEFSITGTHRSAE